ncbi:Thioredoxin-like fold protein [Ophiocordyceps camponoti-floridani]|uniref:Thioredoxin-like fold protein n=1 Tax=Ophiocordyceps camponoti-floridani TaxID=2030778 RepID=A0A8H4Q380_9HYPO|nr:Thioredoxin-like fold protein [Ophiocordyceps camponoti-floridani]
MTTYSTNPALFIFTSLTAGSSHIVTATSRLETILRANRVPFKAVDVATDEKARMLWGRRAGKDAAGRARKLPGLVQEGLVLGDLVEIEDWNEYGELKQHVKIYYDEHTIPSIHDKPKQPALRKPQSKQQPKSQPKAPQQNPPAEDASSSTPTPSAPLATATATAIPIRSVADEAAQKAKALRTKALREKVQGKQPPQTSPPSEPPATAPGLQCPSTAAWPPCNDESLQSPGSACWSGRQPEPATAEAPSVQAEVDQSAAPQPPVAAAAKTPGAEPEEVHAAGEREAVRVDDAVGADRVDDVADEDGDGADKDE